MGKKVILVIMDGWGEGNGSSSDVIAAADTRFIKSLRHNPDVAYAHLKTSGEDVGLPDGQMGNSEVGHLNIGAGRIVYQDFVRINHAITDGSIENADQLCNAYAYARDNNKQVHLIGLVSDGGVHAATPHLMKLCDVAGTFGLEKVFIHVLTDGRDTDPHSGAGYVGQLADFLKGSTGKIATVCGRYYTMDRDRRWERIKMGYDLLVHGKGKPFSNPVEAIQASYDDGVTDEFIKPVVIVDEQGHPLTTVQEGDVVICFNFRTDRLREITTALTQKDMPDCGMQTIPLHYVTMTRYDEHFRNIHVIFDKEDLDNTLGEVLANHNKKQLRISETEKYPHVTFFFSGGREDVFEHEDRILIPSPKVPTYDMKPSMSAVEVKDAVVAGLKKGIYDFVCLNFANADMVGHTGVYQAIKEAVETVDKCVKEVAETAVSMGYTVLITADHGNADNAVNQDSSPNTAHSMNPVPLFMLDKEPHTLKNGRLCDLAPTILHLMQLPIPKEMTGQILVKD